MAQPLPLVLQAMQPPLLILLLPPGPGSWGIAYDIGTNATDRDAPNGWNAHRCEKQYYI
jgi:hypothetical protein